MQLDLVQVGPPPLPECTMCRCELESFSHLQCMCPALGQSSPGVTAVGFTQQDVDSLNAWDGGAYRLSLLRVAASNGQHVRPRLGRLWDPALAAGRFASARIGLL